MIPKKIIPLVAILIFINNLRASADIIHIPGDYPTIQEGIDAAYEHDTVLVKPGEYVENIDFIGKNIVVASLYLTTGNPEFIPLTIIDGDSSGSVVTFQNGEDSTAVIMGFTLRNGLSHYGGGIHCEDSAPKICNNIISDNFGPSGYFGGGIYCKYSEAIIRENTITSNRACWGGGIYSYRSTVNIVNNNIIFNSAYQ